MNHLRWSDASHQISAACVFICTSTQNILQGGYRNVRSCHLEERIDIMKLRELLCCMDLVLQLYFYIINDLCTANDSRNTETHTREDEWKQKDAETNKQTRNLKHLFNLAGVHV